MNKEDYNQARREFYYHWIKGLKLRYDKIRELARLNGDIKTIWNNEEYRQLFWEIKRVCSLFYGWNFYHKSNKVVIWGERF